VTLTIERGTIHGLVGENGAGKSTLGKIIAGVHRADRGRVIINGRAVDYHSPRAALAEGVTMIAQEPTLVPRRSVLKNVFLGREGAHLGFINRRMIRDRYATLSEHVGFQLPPGQPVGQLSVAEQQKVEVMRAVARDARLIVMDEPTAALTADEAERLFDTVRRLRDGGATIVYVSHFLSEVLGLVDTITVLRDGRVVRTASASDETPDSLVAAMLGRPMDLTFPEKQLPPQDAGVVLEVTGLTRPPRVWDVSFEVRAGEIVGLSGLIGSGRTEVARTIFAADRADSGLVRLSGQPVSLRSPRDAIKAGIAMLPESRKEQGLLMRRSITSNMVLPHLQTLAHEGIRSERTENRIVERLSQRLDVRAKSLTATVDTLSGGNQQKVLFGKWLLKRPQILVADEPTRGIDVGAKRAIYDLLHSLARDGVGILLISSEHEEIIGLAHRVLVMRQGRIVKELIGDQICESEIMQAAFDTTTDAASAGSTGSRS
jgi:simple sugar transport system ATP-binding protein/ribose transport system ATP-binding protein